VRASGALHVLEHLAQDPKELVADGPGAQRHAVGIDRHRRAGGARPARRVLAHGVLQARVEEGLAAAALATAASEERSRVAREMHDSLAKTLHGISLTAVALSKRVERDPRAAAVDARVLSEAAERAAEEARELITDLRADQLDASLEDAVREYAASWSRATGTPVSVDADGVQLRSPAVRYELFRILREVLENVERHARAHSVSVRLESPGGGLRMSVADDGVGTRSGSDLSELEPAGHFGLIGIAERARRLGGGAELVGSEGRGTTVIVTVPPPGEGNGGDPEPGETEHR
jgi:signal transduction histidine kinase